MSWQLNESSVDKINMIGVFAASRLLYVRFRITYIHWKAQRWKECYGVLSHAIGVVSQHEQNHIFFYIFHINMTFVFWIYTEFINSVLNVSLLVQLY